MSVFSSLRSYLESLHFSLLPPQDEAGLWRPTRRTHLLHLGVAVFLVVLSPYLGTPREVTVLALTAVASLALPLTSVFPGVGAVVSFAVMWIASAVPHTTGLIASMAIWGVVAILLARGMSRPLVYGYGAAALTVVVYYDGRQELFGASLVWIVIIAVPCVVFGETVRYQRKRVLDASLRRRKALARQRRLVASELHDTVASDLAYAVMAAERLRAARSDDVDLVRELDAVIEPVRAAVGQLRRSLQSMAAVGNGDTVLFSSAVSPRSMGQVFGDVQRVLRERESRLEVKGIEMLESDNVFAPGTRQQVLRVIGELVNNVAKYAAAHDRAMVAVEINGDVFECVVTNSTDPNRSKDVALSSGVGLDGARRRVENLGGDFVVSHDGGRWTVLFTVPISGGWSDVAS